MVRIGLAFLMACVAVPVLALDYSDYDAVCVAMVAEFEELELPVQDHETCVCESKALAAEFGHDKLVLMSRYWLEEDSVSEADLEAAGLMEISDEVADKVEAMCRG